MMDIPGTTEEALLAWIKTAIKGNTNLLSAGYQGKVFLYRNADASCVIKVAPSVILWRWLYVLMLRREYRAYQVLQGLSGVPKCYGLLRGRYLVLQYIDGNTLRKVQPDCKKQYYADFLELLLKMHALGVAHSDLKRKDNILVSSDDKPYLVDYGAAIVLKKRFAPLNRCLFLLAKRFDLNAWVKHKYGKDFNAISQEDRHYYKRTRIERWAKAVKRNYRQIKYFLFKR